MAFKGRKWCKGRKWWIALPQRPPEAIATVSQRVVLLAVGIVLAWIIVQGWYAVASADDFCYGNRGFHDGVLNTVISEYWQWGGRYWSTFLIAWFASHHDLLTRYYFVCPFVILAANFAASHHFLKKTGVGCRYFSIIFFVLLITAYSLRQSVFWLSGGFTYGLACALFIALIGEEFFVFSEDAVPAKGRMICLSFAAFLLAGSNETIMVAHIALLSILFYASYVHKRKIAWPIGILLLVAVIGAIIVYLAPGNAIRGMHFPHRYLLLALLKSFFWLFWKYGIFLLPTLVIFYCALVLFSPSLRKAVPTVPAAWYNLSLFCALWASAFARFYTKNSSGPDRTHTVDYMLVTLLAFMMALYLYRKRKDDIGKALHMLYEMKLLPYVHVLMVGTFLTFLIRPVMDPLIIKTSLHDISYAAALHRYMSARMGIMRNEPNAEVTGLADDPDKNQAITFFGDITPDADDWRNICFASYYHLNKVRLSPASSGK